METQFTWLIEQMQCAPQKEGETDVVVVACWRCNGVFADTYGTAYGACNFTYTGGSFTPYDQLTQNQVLGWCWSNGVDKDAVQAAVDKQIQDQITPPIVVLPLPWASNAP